jgi:hypothetical protein
MHWICWNTTGASITIGGGSTCPAGSTAYTGPINVSSSATYYAKAGGPGYGDSTMSSATYVINASSGGSVMRGVMKGVMR